MVMLDVGHRPGCISTYVVVLIAIRNCARSVCWGGRGGGGGGRGGDIFHLLILLKINRTCEYLQLEKKN